MEQELKKPIKDTTIKFEEIVFGINSLIYFNNLDEFKKKQVMKKCIEKRSWRMH